MFVSAKYTRDTKSKDAMYVWLENVNSGSFEVCIREFLPFDGKHQDTIVVSDMSSLFIFRSAGWFLCALLHVLAARGYSTTLFGV